VNISSLLFSLFSTQICTNRKQSEINEILFLNNSGKENKNRTFFSNEVASFMVHLTHVNNV